MSGVSGVRVRVEEVEEDVSAVMMSDSEVEVQEVDSEAAPSLKRKRNLTSSVWLNFDLVPQKDGKLKAKCKNCGQLYSYDSKRGGTTTLKRHRCKPGHGTQDVGQMLLSSKNGQVATRARKIDQMKYRDYVSVLIIARNLPLSLVEWPEFRNLCKYLNEDVKPLSRNTEKADILRKHKLQKELVRNILKCAPGRMCLTSDLWTSVTTSGYISLTVHFVDQEWVLRKYLLNFSPLPPPHSAEALSGKLFAMLEDWGIEEKVFIITLDNAAANKACCGSMVSRLNKKKILFNEGKYFHVRCCAHILALIVKDGLTQIDPAVMKIRKYVKYLKSSQVRKQKFLDTVEDLGMGDIRMGVRQDVKTRWNSIFLMLESCIPYEEVFTHLKLLDKDYEDAPTADEWSQIKVVTMFLKAFYDLTTLFSGSKYPTSNLYFEGICHIQVLLTKESSNEIDFIRDMAVEMQKKYDKYWKKLSPLLSMAVVLDPRLKLGFVKHTYQKLYPVESELKKNVDDVRKRMKRLYKEYHNLAHSGASTSSAARNSGTPRPSGTPYMQEFAAAQASGGLQPDMSELDQYLSEVVLNMDTPDFTVLTYWKAQELRFPVLTRMARDILAVPISTVASESAFSIGGRVISRFRSSLTPENAEAIITTRDWEFGVGAEDVDEDNDIEEDVTETEASTITDEAILIG